VLGATIGRPLLANSPEPATRSDARTHPQMPAAYGGAWQRPSCHLARLISPLFDYQYHDTDNNDAGSQPFLMSHCFIT
jgi:hypothetical protein